MATVVKHCRMDEVDALGLEKAAKEEGLTESAFIKMAILKAITGTDFPREIQGAEVCEVLVGQQMLADQIAGLRDDFAMLINRLQDRG